MMLFQFQRENSLKSIRVFILLTAALGSSLQLGRKRMRGDGASDYNGWYLNASIDEDGEENIFHIEMIGHLSKHQYAGSGRGD